MPPQTPQDPIQPTQPQTPAGPDPLPPQPTQQPAQTPQPLTAEQAPQQVQTPTATTLSAMSAGEASKKSKKIIIAAVSLVSVLIIAVLVFFIFIKSDSSNTDTNNSEATSELPKEEVVPGGGTNLDSSNSATDDKTTELNRIQAKTDLNNMHSKLEEYYNETGVYPTTFDTVTLPGIDQASLEDQNDNIVERSGYVSNTLPFTDPYTADEPDGPHYTYAAYRCTGTTAADTCEKYTIYAWLSGQKLGSYKSYSKNSLN